MSASAAPSWQGWQPSWAAPVQPSWRDTDVLDYSTTPAYIAGEELTHMLTELKTAGVLSAKQVCILAFWAAKAGACGEACNMAVRPDQASGEYSKRFDKWAGVSLHSQNHYPVWMGRRLRHVAGRVWDPLPTKLPHEALEEELDGWSQPLDNLVPALEAGDLPQRYFDHPFVKLAPASDVVHPIRLVP